MLRSNPQIELAHRFLRETGTNIFLTGKAGTGKTTFLREALRTINKRYVVCAPTGVAAINARGVTLHSLFQLPFGAISPEMLRGGELLGRKIGSNKLALLRSIELLVIDEISMVRCDVLDGVDSILKRVRRNSKPFGGVQLLMIGDVHQLSPICRDDEWELLRGSYRSPYFFESAALGRCNYFTIEFTEIFRQSDRSFTELLNAVREGAPSADVIARLNSRYIPNFDPPEGYITLSTHNYSVTAINAQKLRELHAKSHYFTAEITGEYSDYSYPNDKELELKEGAQVIFIKNDISPEKLYYNGMIGKILSIEGEVITVQTPERLIAVSRVSWENIEYKINKESGRIEENIKGVFSQIPLRCAWAITIHKSQGLTFEKVVIDAGSSFAFGQVYVALSRCKTFEGMVLRTPLQPSVVVRDSVVESFTVHSDERRPSGADLELSTREYYAELLCEIFNFEGFARVVDRLFSLVGGVLHSDSSDLEERLRNFNWRIEDELVKVGESFQRQLRLAVLQSDCYSKDSYLAERLFKASAYYSTRLRELRELFDRVLSEVKSENKEVKRRMKRYGDELSEELQIKEAAMRLCSEGYSTEGYLNAKFGILTQIAKGKSPKERPPRKAKEPRDPKKASYIVTYELYLAGKSPAEISEAQGLVLTTIYTHFAKLIVQGKLPLSDFVDDNRVEVITSAIESVPYEGALKPIKEYLGDGFTYDEIRLVVASVTSMA